MYDNTARIMCFTVKGTEPLTFFTTKKFIAILSQKLGIDLKCICTGLITHGCQDIGLKMCSNGKTDNNNTIKVL